MSESHPKNQTLFSLSKNISSFSLILRWIDTSFMVVFISSSVFWSVFVSVLVFIFVKLCRVVVEWVLNLNSAEQNVCIAVHIHTNQNTEQAWFSHVSETLRLGFIFAVQCSFCITEVCWDGDVVPCLDGLFMVWCALLSVFLYCCYCLFLFLQKWEISDLFCTVITLLYI